MKIVDGRLYIRQVREMITVYTNALARDLTFQNLDEELADPESKYCPPFGEILVSIEDDEPLGMVAYHRHSTERCEMKRLFVYPEHRNKGTGEQLISEILDQARSSGYAEMVLDTLRPMESAIALYKRFGFEECEPYYYNPFPDVIYLKKPLR